MFAKGCPSGLINMTKVNEYIWIRDTFGFTMMVTRGTRIFI